MCRPTHYTIAYEINPWMSVKRQTARSLAIKQWDALYRVLTKTLKCRVRLLPPAKDLPDLVFTANAGLVVGRTVIRSNFRHPERQGEESIVEQYFRKLRMRVVDLPRKHNFEGEGDALFLGETLFLGFRFRSDASSHEPIAKLIRRRVLPLELSNRRFYHLDTCFCPLPPGAALWFPGAFDPYGRKVIEANVPDLIAVSERDARRFACNAVVVGRDIVTNAGVSVTFRRQLTQRGYRLHEVDLSEFLKAGGAAKCLVLRLENPC